MPAVSSYCQVNAQNADTHIPIGGAVSLIYVPLVDWCQNLAVINCIVQCFPIFFG